MKRWLFLIVIFALAVRILLAVYWERRLTTTQSIPSNPTEQVTQTEQIQTDQLISANSKTNGSNTAHPSSAKDGPFFFGDSDSYWKLGRALAFGRPYEFDSERHWTVFRMPGYPAILAPLFKVEGEHPNIFYARLIGCMFGAFSVLMTGLIAWQLFNDRKAAILAALIAALEPCCAIQSVLILAEEPFVAAMLTQIYLLILLFQNFEGENFIKKSIGPALLLGLISAWTVYFRPSWYYFPLGVFLFALLWRLFKKDFFCKKTADSILLFLVGLLVFAVALSPWWIRNYRLTGKYIPTTLQMGASLYDGLSPIADGSSNMKYIDEFRQQEIVATGPIGKTAAERARFEVRLDERLRNASLDWCQEHPSEVLLLAGVKFFRLWNIIPNESSLGAPIVKIALVMTNLPIILLGLIGFILLYRRGAQYWLLILPAGYLTLLHVIFVSSIRYRTPAMYGLIILTAFVLLKAEKALFHRNIHKKD